VARGAEIEPSGAAIEGAILEDRTFRSGPVNVSVPCSRP
jgi:hypothetical protein